jgi:hypothetical protein
MMEDAAETRWCELLRSIVNALKKLACDESGGRLLIASIVLPTRGVALELL